MEQNKEKIFVFYSEPINFKTVESDTGKEFFVEGYISTHDIDLVDDIVTKSGMNDMFSQFSDRTIKLDFEHEAFRGDNDIEKQINKTLMPLGKSIDRFQDDVGIGIKWQLNPNWKKFDDKGNITMTFKEVWENIEQKFYDAFSIAYIPTRTAEQQLKNGTNARLLDGINLLNVALTGNPVNTNAKMTAVMAKSLEYLKDKEGIIMVKTKDEPVVPEPVEPTPVEPTPEPAPAEPDTKANTLALEVKSLSEELKTIKKSMDEMKAIFEKPHFKSLMEPMKKDTNIEMTGPLDTI